MNRANMNKDEVFQTKLRYSHSRMFATPIILLSAAMLFLVLSVDAQRR